MAKTISELKAQSAEVKNASAIGENTATRVGQLFGDIVEHVEQYEMNKDGKDASQDAQMQSLVSAEETRAKGEESTLRYQIAAEVNARTQGDQKLENDLVGERSARATADENIRTALANETARAQAAEQELAAAQIYTAKIKDGAVTTPKIADGAVTYEKTDIIAQELGTNITKVPSQKVVTDAVKKEETERKADVEGLAAALASETIQREQGDENMNAAIEAEAEARSQNDALLNQAIADETARAKAAEAEARRQAIDDIGIAGAYGDEVGDLSIADENGNVLVDLSEGHIETKNFNSKNINNAIVAETAKAMAAEAEARRQAIDDIGIAGAYGDEVGDLSIADENGNVLVDLSEGHIETKNFNSKNIKIEVVNINNENILILNK